MLKNQKGFLLISIIFIMLLMAVSIFSINYYSVTQVRMASNQIDSVQTSYDLNAIVEQSVWKLTDNLFWRTNEAGEDYPGNTSYTRIVRNANTAPFNYPSAYDDAVTIQVTPKGSDQSFQKSFRYYASIFAGTDRELNEPRSIFKDSSGNLYIASTKYHKIYKVDTSGNVSIVAGTGDGGDEGDLGPATDAKLNEPSSVYKDSSGNIYIADTKNHKIRKVDAFGIISTIAGTGDAGDTGDDGAATLARLNEPRGVFIDTSGAIYIADTKNHKIRWINASGRIRPIAGTGASGNAGDGGDALSALLNEPSGIFKDATDLYIADTKNHKIRKVNLSTNIISRIAGSENSIYGDAGDGGDALLALLNEPISIFKDGTDLYIADTKNHKIRKVDASGIISTIAGTGDAGNTGDGAAATLARLNEPNNMVFFSGELYIADTKNHIIRKVDTSGDISTIVGGGVLGDGGFARLARLNEPNGVFKDDTDLYIADARNHRIRKIDLLTNIITTIAGTGVSGDTGDGGVATLAQLNEPRSVFKDGSDVYIADTKNHKIRKVNLSSNIISTIAGTGDAGDAGDGGDAAYAKLNEPSDVFKDGTDVYIADTKNHKIRKVNLSSNIISTIAGTGDAGDAGDGGPATDAKLDEPRGIFKDGTDLYIADTKNHKIRLVDSSGDISTVAGGGDQDPGDGGPATSAKLKEPRDIFVDHNKNIFIVDWGNRRIRVVNAIDNIIYTLAGTGVSGDDVDMPAVYADLKDPAGITMATSHGCSQIFISDTGNHKIKVLELKTVYGL